MKNSEKITSAAKKLKKVTMESTKTSESSTLSNKKTFLSNSEKIKKASKQLKNNSKVLQNNSKISNTSQKIAEASKVLNGSRTYNVEAEAAKLEKMQKNKQAAYDVSKQRLDLQNKIYMQALAAGDDDATAKQKALTSPELAAFDTKLSELGYEYKANTNGTPYSVFSQLEQKEKEHKIKSIEANILQAGDYKEKSVYIPQTKKDTNVVDHVKTVLGNIDSELYAYINDPALREDIDIKYQEGNSGNYYSNNGYHLLTDDEKGVYNYLYSQDKNKARKYLDVILPDLRKRATEQIEEKAVAIAQEHPGVATALSFGTNLADAYMAPIKAGALVLGKYDDAQGVLDRGSAVTTAIRQEGAKDAAEKIPVNVPLIDKNLGELLYGAGTSIGDMAVAMAAGGKNSKAVAAIMSSSAGSSAVTSAKKNGASDIEALARGVGAAAIEYATEKWSVEKLFAEPKTALSYFTQNVVAEGAEEGISNISNVALDVVVSDIHNHENEIRRDINRLVAEENLSEKEATKKVLISRLQDVGSDVLVGSFTGATMSAPTTIKTSVSQKQFDKKYIDKDALSEFSNKTEVKTASRNIAGAVLKGAVLGSSSKSDILNNMYERGYAPSTIIKDSMSDNSSLSDELVSSLNSIVDNLDVEFASAMYSDNPTASARAATDTYMKALSIANAVNAIKSASAVSDSLSLENINEKTAKKSLKKASAQLPNHLSVNAEVGNVYENISKIIENANNYILSESENVYETASDFSLQMIDVLNEASNTVGNVKNKSAVADMLMNGNIESNVNTVLSDKGATRLLENVLGMYITSGTKRSEVVSRIYEMRAAYRTGKGTEYSQRVSRKLNKLQMYSRQLNRLGIKGDAFSFVIDGFRNTILNGKLTQSQAEAIAENKSAYDLFVKVTAGVLTDNSTIDDMISAAGRVAGFDISSDISAYSESEISETVESDNLVPKNETGIYDAEAGRIVLNKNAPLNKKLGYRLARNINNTKAVVNNYSYTSLIKNTDIQIKAFVPLWSAVVSGYESNRSEFSVNMVKRVRKLNNKKNTDTKTFAHCPALNEDILISRNSFKHGAARANDTYYDVCNNITDVIENSFVINELTPREDTQGAFVLIGTLQNDADIVFVRLVVEKKNWQSESYLSLKAIGTTKIKKEDVDGLKPSQDYAKGGSQTSSVISIPDLLNNVKNKQLINSVMSDDVISQLGAQRIVDKNITYSLIDNISKNKALGSLTDDILKYMRSSGYDVDAEYARVIKKFNPYVLEHRSRINSSFLTDENFGNEVAADFLTKVFTEPAEMERLADTDLSLAVDLAERVKTFANTATDKQMKDFANSMFSNFYNLFRSEKVNSIKMGDVLKNRRESGLSYEGIIEADSKTRKFEKDVKNKFQKMKDNLTETLNDMRRDWIDYGEAVGRLAEVIGMSEKKQKKGETSLYAYYNSIRQAKATAEVMITKRSINLDGDEVGKSLVDIFKPFYEKGVIKQFDEYIQLLNNSERAKNGKAIKKGLNSEESIYRAKLIEAKHPEFVEARNDYYKFMDNLLQMRVETGLLSEEEANTIKNSNKHYAPAFFFEKESGFSPYFEDNIVISKTIKKASGGDGDTMPVFQASAIVASQVVFEARLNRFFVVIENNLIENGKISEVDGEYIVTDPEISKFFHSITPTTNRHVRKPPTIDGVYITPKATSELADNIKRLFDYSDNKKKINNLVREFAKFVTSHEDYDAPVINSLLNDLQKLGAKRNEKTVKKNSIIKNMEEIADMLSVHDVPKNKLERSGKRPKEVFNEFFNSLGNSVHTEEFGNISLTNSSAKSEVRHGITAEKIASIEAIPDVLQKGKVIFSETKPDSDVQRIVVCAPIKIGVEPYYMGVMIQKDSRSQRLYLHNVVIEKEMSTTSQADRLTNGALEEQHLYITNIIQKALEVKRKKKKVSDIKLKVHAPAELIVDLCNIAVEKAKNERIEIAQKYNGEKYQKYDIDSLSNMSHSLDEQDGRHIFYYNNGIRRAAIVGDGMYEAVKHLKHISDAQRADDWIRKINITYKKALTSWEPDFAGRNAVKDLFTANISTHRSFLVYNLYYFRTLLYDLWGYSDSKYYKEFEALGGFGGTYFDYDQFIRLEVEDTIKNKLRKGVGYVTLATPSAALNERIEALPRLAEYIAERKKGKSKIEAMYSAAEVTVNFSRAGITGKRWNATWVPFLNASIQGTDKLVRLFKERPARGLLLTGLNLVLLGFGTKAVNDFIHSLVGGDDEDKMYDQLTDYQKQNNILIPTGDGEYFKIPKGRELAALAIILDGADNTMKGEDVDWWTVIRTATEQVTPNNPLTNNLFSAMNDVKNNKTWYGTDIVDQGMAKRADELEYDENTSRIAVWLGGIFKYSPKKIDYLLEQYGTYVTDVIKNATTPSKNENIAESAITLLAGAFIIDGKASNRVSSDFYGEIANLEEEKTDWRIENRTPATVACKFMNSFDKEIGQLYNEISEVNSKDLSAAESTKQIREIKTKITAIMLGAMEEKEKVYEAAKNVKSKYAYKRGNSYYDEAGYEITEERYHDIIYREVNREVFGAEYALQTYDTKVYAKAAEAVKDGADFDLYYDAYFDTKSIEGDIDFTKGTIISGSARKNKWNKIKRMDASRKERAAVASSILDIDDKKLNEASSYGIDRFDYIDFLCTTSAYSSDKQSSKKDKVLRYINSMDVSRKEKDSLYLLAGYSKKTISDAPWR